MHSGKIAIEVDEHLHRCLVYIDLNMVRAGVVTHPSDWTHSGYQEKRYGIIDLRELSSLCGFSEVPEFQQAHRRRVDDSLTRQRMAREGRWPWNRRNASRLIVATHQGFFS